MYNKVILNKEKFSVLTELLRKQQEYHFNLDPENNKRFLAVGINEFTEYMTKTSDYLCYAAIDSDDAPVGFVACTILSENNISEGFIEDIFVEENIRHLKLGTELMRKLLSDLEDREIDTVRVHVTKNNESVFTFYEKFGFKLESCDDMGYLLSKSIDNPQ